jgi:hypothetical protein
MNQYGKDVRNKGKIFDVDVMYAPTGLRLQHVHCPRMRQVELEAWVFCRRSFLDPAAVDGSPGLVRGNHHHACQGEKFQ